MAIRVGIGGITGWTGSCIAKTILEGKVSGFELVAGLSRKSAGKDIGESLGLKASGSKISGTIADALVQKIDVWIDYTHPSAVKENTVTAIQNLTAVVIGTSGLTSDDYSDIAKAAEKAGVGVIAAGNFSITAALAKQFALIASDYLPHREVIEYFKGTKPDAPSGTVRELAEALGARNPNKLLYPIEDTLGVRETRGAQMAGTPVHAVRLPGFTSSFEVLFGLPNERLSIKHDSGTGAEPYVNGTMLAAKKALETNGLIRGLDTLLFKK